MRTPKMQLAIICGVCVVLLVLLIAATRPTRLTPNRILSSAEVCGCVSDDYDAVKSTDDMLEVSADEYRVMTRTIQEHPVFRPMYYGNMSGDKEHKIMTRGGLRVANQFINRQMSMLATIENDGRIPAAREEFFKALWAPPEEITGVKPPVHEAKAESADLQ